jgi:hypothetical protein
MLVLSIAENENVQVWFRSQRHNVQTKFHPNSPSVLDMDQVDEPTNTHDRPYMRLFCAHTANEA